MQQEVQLQFKDFGLTHLVGLAVLIAGPANLRNIQLPGCGCTLLRFYHVHNAADIFTVSLLQFTLVFGPIWDEGFFDVEVIAYPIKWVARPGPVKVLFAILVGFS